MPTAPIDVSKPFQFGECIRICTAPNACVRLPQLAVNRKFRGAPALAKVKCVAVHAVRSRPADRKIRSEEMKRDFIYIHGNVKVRNAGGRFEHHVCRSYYARFPQFRRLEETQQYLTYFEVPRLYNHNSRQLGT